MSYLDSGFNDYLQRDIGVSKGNSLSALDSDALLEGIDISKILSTGSLNSSDGKTTFNLEGGNYIFNDGAIERLRMGLMEDGSYGMRIKDKNGTVIFNFTGDNNIIQSSDQTMQADFSKNQIRFYDELNKNLRMILGDLAVT